MSFRTLQAADLFLIYDLYSLCLGIFSFLKKILFSIPLFSQRAKETTNIHFSYSKERYRRGTYHILQKVSMEKQFYKKSEYCRPYYQIRKRINNTIME